MRPIVTVDVEVLDGFSSAPTLDQFMRTGLAGVDAAFGFIRILAPDVWAVGVRLAAGTRLATGSPESFPGTADNFRLEGRTCVFVV